MSADPRTHFISKSPEASLAVGPAPFLQLPYDIVVLITAYLDKAEVLALMRVCRALNSSLDSTLLRLPITIRVTSRLISFCTYMLANSPTRCECLLSLTLDISFIWTSKISGTLVQIMQQAIHLQELGILDCSLLEEEASLLAAIEALPALKKLKLSSPTSAVRGMLRRMRSCLLHVDIVFPENRRRLEPKDLLGKHGPSLLSMTMAVFNVPDLGGQCPLLTRLILSSHRCILASRIAYSFPNLRRLMISTCPDHCSHRTSAATDLEFESTRAKNLAARDTYVRPPLEYLGGDVLSLYHLAIAGHVRQATVTFFPLARMGWLRSVLRDLRPHSLEIMLNAGASHPDDLRGLAFSEPHTVHCLSLSLDTGSSAVHKAFIVSSPPDPAYTRLIEYYS